MLIPIVKYSLPLAATLLGGLIYHLCFKESEFDKVLRQDLENDVECNIINYLDGDKISLTRSEIRRYSAAYSNLLSRLDKNREVKDEKVYDKLRACALFFIRTDARLKRTKSKATYEETRRYFTDKGICTLSKKLAGKFADRKIRYDNDYLYYHLEGHHDLSIDVGPSGPWGWTTHFGPFGSQDIVFRYENCKPTKT